MQEKEEEEGGEKKKKKPESIDQGYFGIIGIVFTISYHRQGPLWALQLAHLSVWASHPTSLALEYQPSYVFRG